LKQAVPTSRYLVFFSLVIAGCAADLASKSWMFAWLGMPDPGVETWWLWHGVFGFQTSLNEGALFGLGQGFALLFAALALVAAVGILVWLFVVGAAHDWLLTIALALVTVGIFGNLYDRLGLHGLDWPRGCPGREPGTPIHAVRDFIVMLQIGEWHWPNYNLADSSLVGGAALLMWHALFTNGDREKRSDVSTEQNGADLG
jgi:signal peptidase II